MQQETPRRENNNYAAPQTPIASVKRPRNNNCGASSSRQNNNGSIATTPLPSSSKNDSTPQGRLETPHEKPELEQNGANQCMSPMHPPKPMKTHDGDEGNENGAADEDTATWVGRQVDAIFSPVLNFLKGADGVTQVETASTETSIDVAMEEVVEEGIMPAHDHGPSYSDEDGSTLEEDVEQQDSYEEEFNPYLFIKTLPPYSSVVTEPPRIWLPPKDESDPPVSLVLDLDETLVHCTVDPIPDPDMVFPVEFHGVEYIVHVKTRPHLREFLEKVSQDFEVIVFTASQRVYANELLDRIDPGRRFVKHRIFRESCLPVEGNYLKDLNVLGRDLKKAVLVDNSPHAFGYQVENGIPIESWFDDPNDTELLKLEVFLRSLHNVDDVRPIVSSKFQTQQRIMDA